jgi:serine/threonine-protein kinase
MGEVYRARDRELDDLIALKVVRPDLLVWPDVLERFRREVKLARRVTHANVARAFELGIADGVTFYTMELVEGMPLSQRLAVGRRLAPGEAAAIAVALCDALGAAHDAGIVHRDVKPGNVLIGEDGRIVLTDFGIAEVNLAELGKLEGTPRFMAPEQALGEAATPAADIYALGVVLYEMLTGTPAFAGSAAEILEAKQRVDHLVVDDVDARLGEVVAAATRRDPALRPRSAHELRQALAPFARGSMRELPRHPEPSHRRARPLPTVIVRAAAAPEGIEYLARGFHQAFIDRLVQWPRLRVVPRDDGGHASAVLVDLSVQEGEDEAVLAASARSASFVLRLPFDIDSLAPSAEQAARMVAVLAGSDAAPPPVRSHVPPPAAHALILRARHDARRDRLTLAAGVAHCEQALALAPGNPRVLAALAACQAQLAFYAALDAPLLLEDAAGHALAALAAAPELAEAHFARAHVELHSGRPVIAAVCFRAAIARAPLMAEAHEWLGRMLLEAGFIVDAVARLEDALATDRPPMLRWELALAQALDGKWYEVDREIAELRGLGIDNGASFRMRIASWRGDRAAEAAATAEVARLGGRISFARELAIYDPDRPWPERRAAALASASDRKLGSARRRAYFAQLAAEAAGRSGDVETCLMMLLRANAEGLFDLHWLDHCPLLEPVRKEPRYAVIRTDVAARAEAIHDALYSDHRDQATVATAVVHS